MQTENHERRRDSLDDLDTIDANLAEAQSNYISAAEYAGYERRLLRAIRPYYDPANLSGATGPTMAAGAVVIADLREASNKLRTNSKYATQEVYLTASTASSLAYGTLSMHMSAWPGLEYEPVKQVLDQKNETQFVETELRKIDESLAKEYRTVWQYFDLPASDPMRGPLFLMRQVFDHLLERLGPDDKILEWPAFQPDPTVKARDGKGITRPHRLRYAAYARIQDPSRRKLILDSTQYFTSTYTELNQAHKRGELNEEAAKQAVYAANNLIAAWLKAITE